MSEISRRKREIISLLPLLLLFVGLTWFQFRLFAISEQLPFYYAIFFFGLVNANLLIFLLLLYLVFRNLVKVYTESKIPLFGKTLRTKLMVAFFAFAFVPTALMFLVSIFYINSSFDRWFALKGMGILDDSIQVTELYYQNLKKESYFLASQVAKSLSAKPLNESIKKSLKNLASQSQSDSLEIYDLNKKERWFTTSNLNAQEQTSASSVPPISWEMVEAQFKRGGEFSISEDIGTKQGGVNAGRLIRSILTLEKEGKVVVVNKLIPFFLVEQMNSIIEARDDYRQLTPFEFPLKSIYIITLVLMTLVILAGGTWFGLYLAGQLSKSLESLGRATREIAKGKYRSLKIDTGSYEVDRLVANFNLMSQTIERSRTEADNANVTLKRALNQLQESSDNIQTVIEHISTAVIAIDSQEVITLVNKNAEELLTLNEAKIRGQKIEKVLNSTLYNVFFKHKDRLQSESLSYFSTEEKIELLSGALHLKCTVSCLYNDNGSIRGYVLTYDDISLIAKAQRVEAWTEVATRVAHEIKNPLTPIKLSAERLQKKFGTIEDPAFSESIRMIIQQVDIVKNLVNEFSYHARLPQLNLEKGSINDLVQENLWIYRHKVKSLNIDFKPDLDIPQFYFDHDQIKRVIINLIDNATDALEGVKEPKLFVQTRGLNETQMVQVKIGDNGVGIPPELAKKVFEPNYTTKTTGTGLGLSIVKKMIEEHSGRIFVQRENEWTFLVFEIPYKSQAKTK